MNPWQELHEATEVDFQDDPRIARAVVANEYRDAPESFNCSCGGTFFYRATIGAMQCTSCRSLAHTNGELI